MFGINLAADGSDLVSLTGTNQTIVVVVALVALAALGVAAFFVREVLAAQQAHCLPVGVACRRPVAAGEADIAQIGMATRSEGMLRPQRVLPHLECALEQGLGCIMAAAFHLHLAQMLHLLLPQLAKQLLLGQV